jgi:diaminopimelate decarboxylase
LVDLALRTFQEHVPEQLNFGGGYYGRMGDELRRRLRAPRTSFQEYAEPIIQRMTEAFPEAASRPLVVLEPGTGVVADAFSFVCRVTGVKRVWETNVATVAGSLLDVTPTANRALLPAEVIARHVRPAALRPWTVGGFTCMEDDLLSEDMLGAVEVGDFMVFANAGSYSISMRPPFIAPRAPIVSIGEGFDLDSARLIKRPETIQDVFASFSSDGWDLPQD